MPSVARSRQFRHPARLVVAGFAAVIAIGTVLLLLPVATTGPGGASFHNAVFQSTAAVTLAGLGIVDVPTYWSPTGQAIILGLTQVGALGIVTSSLILIVLIAGRVGLRGRLAAQAETRTTGLGGMRRLVVGIVVFTLAAQAIVSLVLFALLLGAGRSGGDAAWEGLFHGVAAFNNTGISITPGGAAAFAGEPAILATIAAAVVVGGLGFPVWLELQRNPRNPSRWNLHAKLTLAATGVLLVLGTVVMTALEWSNPRTLGGMSGIDRIVNGVFSGIMPRTAGFASIDHGEIYPDSLLFTEMLMFAGGGSGSVAGGIKVSTLALLVFVVIAEIRGEAEVNAFRRRIPQAVQRQALTVAALSINTIVLGALVVLASNELPFADVVFEVTAAFTTAGLSTGITAELNGLGHAVLMVLMFLGRIGPLTLGVALVLRERDRRYSHPDERPLVG